MKKVTFKSLGYNLVGLIEYPREATSSGVILFHGLTNSKEDCPLIKEAADVLVKAGFITFRFDFYGSGESPGELKDKTWSIMEQNARDAVEYFINECKVTRIGLWGRSTGGTAAILCSDFPQVKAFVLATPAILLSKLFHPSEFERLKKLEEEAKRKGGALPGTGKYKGSYSFHPKLFEEAPLYEDKLMKKLRKMSHVLVLATTPDTKVPLENATTVINMVKEPKEIHIFEGVDHDYKGVEKEVLNFQKNWFKRYLSVLQDERGEGN